MIDTDLLLLDILNLDNLRNASLQKFLITKKIAVEQIEVDKVTFNPFSLLLPKDVLFVVHLIHVLRFAIDFADVAHLSSFLLAESVQITH